MFEAFYAKLQPYFGEKIELHYMDTDSFLLSINTNRIIKDLQNLNDLFYFSNLKKNHELYKIKYKTVIGKFEIETRENIWTDDIICLRSKAYSFKSGSN